MARKTKKAKASSAKQASAESHKLHEPIIQDLIAGIPVMRIAANHTVSRHKVNDVYNANRDHIDDEREKLLSLREKEIHRAFQEERERTGRLITKSGELMELALDAALDQFASGEMSIREVTEETTPDGPKTKTKKAPVTLSDIESIFKNIRSVLIQYQKGADGGQPT